MFLRKRKRYHAPPSFVKFAAFASGVVIGSAFYTPRSDHVPLEM